MPDWITTKAQKAHYRTTERAASLLLDGELSRAWQASEARGDDVASAAYESESDWRNA